MADPGPSPREAKQVPCPQCGTATPFGPANRWRPFCSERCRNIDLGAWASGSYRVPAAPQDGGEAGTPELSAGDGHPS